MSLQVSPQSFNLKPTLLFLLFALIPVLYVSTLLDTTLVSRFLVLSGLCLIYFIFEKIKFAWTWVELLAILSYLWSAITIIWARNFAEALFHTQKAFLFVAVLCILKGSLQSNSAAEHILYKSLLLSNMIVLSVGYFQILNVPKLDLENLYHVVGLNSHKNLLASFLFLSLPFLLVGFIKHKSSLWRYAFFSTLLLSLGMIFLVQTRAVYLALLVSALFTLWLLRKTLRRPHYLKVGLSLVLVLGFIGTIYMFKPHSVPFQQTGELELRKESNGERVALWLKTLNLIDSHTFKGVGAGNWQIEFPALGLEGLKRSQRENVTFQRPHNDYLWVWAETGVVGLLLFLALPLYVFAQGLRTCLTMAPAEPLKIELALLLAILLGFGVISFFDFPKERIEHLLCTACLLALIHERSAVKGMLRIVSFNVDAAARIAFISLLVLNVSIGIKRMKGERETLLAYASRAQGDWHNLILHSDKAKSIFYSIDPTSIPLDWYKGVGNFSLGNIDAALSDFEKAYDFNPNNFHILNNMASAYERQGQHTLAKQYYEKALFINPEFDEARLNLTVVYYNERNYTKALHLVSECVQASDRQKHYLSLIRNKLN